MKRVSLFLDESQIKALENLPGTSSEHVRQAINDYLKKMSPQATTSPSTQKERKNER